MKKVISYLFFTLLISSFVAASSLSVGFTIEDKESAEDELSTNQSTGFFTSVLYIVVALMTVFGFILFKKSKTKNKKTHKAKKKTSKKKK